MKDNYKKLLLIFLVLASFIGCTSTNEEKETLENAKNNNTRYVFEVEDLAKDKQFTNDILKKDINFLTIWQPSCPPCEAESKALDILNAEYPEVNIVGLGIGESKEELIDKINYWGISYDNYKLSESFLEKYSDTIKSTPTLLVVDKNGNELFPIVVGLEGDFENSELHKQKFEEIIRQIQEDLDE